MIFTLGIPLVDERVCEVCTKDPAHHVVNFPNERLVVCGAECLLIYTERIWQKNFEPKGTLFEVFRPKEKA